MRNLLQTGSTGTVQEILVDKIRSEPAHEGQQLLDVVWDDGTHSGSFADQLERVI